MEVQVAKLRDALDLVKPVVPRKPAIPVMTNILLGNGEVLGGDLESAVLATLPEAQEPILLPLEALTQLLKYVPGRNTLSINVKRGKLLLNWDDGSATYAAVKAEDYPPLPELQVTEEVEIAGDSLMAAISSVLPYCSRDETRPILSGITAILGQTTEIAAGDGFRLAYQTLPLSFPSEHILILPEKAVSLLLHLWAKTPRTPPSSNDFIPVITAKKNLAVSLANDDSILRVGFGIARIIIKLIQGKPPEWLQLVPTTPPILKVMVLGGDFERAVKRVKDMASAGSGVVRLEFSDNTMTVSAKAEGNEVRVHVPVMNSEGETTRVAIYASYLLDYLRSKEGIITFSMTDPKAPVSFQYMGSPRVLIMPMYVEW